LDAFRRGHGRQTADGLDMIFGAGLVNGRLSRQARKFTANAAGCDGAVARAARSATTGMRQCASAMLS
jgi:hypothetical protein